MNQENEELKEYIWEQRDKLVSKPSDNSPRGYLSHDLVQRPHSPARICQVEKHGGLEYL